MYTSMIGGPLMAGLALLIGACGTIDDEAVQDYEGLDSDALEAIVARTAGPVRKATVRYHLAVKLIEQANALITLAEKRGRLRERARQAIAGLSDGVADEEFLGGFRSGSLNEGLIDVVQVYDARGATGNARAGAVQLPLLHGRASGEARGGAAV